MIRNVVVGRIRPGVPRKAAEQALAAILVRQPEGCLDMSVGVDADLRPGNRDFSVTADFVDDDAYRCYDGGCEHHRVREELFAAICEDIVRVQLRAR